MSHYVSVLDSFFNSYDVGSSAVPLEQVHELRRRYVTLQVQLLHIDNIRSCYFTSPFWANLTNDLSFQCSLTSAQVTAKYQGIKLEYQESRHTALDLLQCIGAKLQTWKAPYTSREAILLLLKDWHVSVWQKYDIFIYLYIHLYMFQTFAWVILDVVFQESVEHHSVLGTLTDSLQALGEKANAYTSMEAAGNIECWNVQCK